MLVKVVFVGLPLLVVLLVVVDDVTLVVLRVEVVCGGVVWRDVTGPEVLVLQSTRSSHIFKTGSKLRLSGQVMCIGTELKHLQ